MTEPAAQLPPRPPRRRRSLTPLIIGGAIVLFFIAFPALVRLLTDWYWFQEVGFETVFLRTLGTQWALGLGATAFAFAVLYANLRLAQRSMEIDPFVVPLDRATPRPDLSGLIRRAALPAAIFFAVTTGLSAAGGWRAVLEWRFAVPFGVTDPVFGRDISHYVFTLPLLEWTLGLLTGLVVLSLVAVTAIYWLRGHLLATQSGLRVDPTAGMHIGTLAALAFVLTALRIWLVRIPSLLTDTGGLFSGATYVDLAGRLPAMRVLAVVALLAAGWVIWGATRRRVLWHLATAAGAYALVAVVGTGLIPAGMQRLLVDPNELAREAPLLSHHLAATRRAWGLEAIETRDLSGEARLTMAQIERNEETIGNVRLWDRDPLLQTLGQLQEIRTYYDFIEVDDDRYMIDGEYRQVMVSPRELNPASLPTRTFINERLTFTHGMGVTVSPVNEATTEGLPVLFVQDLPPASSVNLRVTRPQIYFGELGDHWIVTGTTQREFDYPEGEANVFTQYEGSGGVPAGSFFRRAMFASRFGSMKLLLTDAIQPESRFMFRRNIVDRARAALPTLRFDGDPYIVVRDDGTLTWLLDGYTRTERYPYSVPLTDGTRYMRNSVKVSIDAYHGTITAYMADPTDPIAQTQSAMFPGIFQPIAAMPADLRTHLRYPEDLYRVQAELYASYHMDDAEEFYAREDQWQIPRLDGAGEATRPFMRHIIMRLPGEEAAEYIFMTPFTPRGKDNLAAWMVARMDGDQYGELRVYRFPKQSLVFGPRQIVNRINQNPDIARQISLWDQRGSEVIRGELLVIPIEEALLYVQPLYLRAEGGRIPELNRVIVAYQNQVVMDETLDRALGQLFGGATTLASADVPESETVPLAAGAPPAAPTGTTPSAALPAGGATVLDQASDAYEAAIRAQRAGDWARYGTEIERLGSLLRRLRSGEQTP